MFRFDRVVKKKFGQYLKKTENYNCGKTRDFLAPAGMFG